MLDQRLDATEALGWHDYLEPFEPLDDPGRIAYLEAQHPAEATHLFLGNRVAGIVGEAGVMDLRDGFVHFQEFRQRFGVVAMFLHADREGLDPPQREPTVEGAGNGA